LPPGSNKGPQRRRQQEHSDRRGDERLAQCVHGMKAPLPLGIAMQSLRRCASLCRAAAMICSALTVMICFS
jgi:hypothetical protein